MPTPIDHLAAMLAQLDEKQLAQLPKAGLQRLSDALYGCHVMAEAVAGQMPFPKVRRNIRPTGILDQLTKEDGR